VSQPNPAISWKQEVSRRIAEHQSRKGESTAQSATPVQRWASAGSRAGQAAARVAARYAQAPSYSQMQAAETHAALRAAQVATQAALKANATAQAALAGLQATTPKGPRLWEPEAPQAVASAPSAARDREPTVTPHLLVVPSSLEAWESESHIRWEPDLRLLPLKPVSAPAGARAPRQVEDTASVAEEEWEQPSLLTEPWNGRELEAVEPDLPIHANLIEFPRELVATRRMRPHREEGPLMMDGLDRQLSIFEVDPGTISDQPEVASAAPASTWREPEWSGIELDAQPMDESEPENELSSQIVLELAPIGSRLTAALVDGVLIFGACLGSAAVAAAYIGHPPNAKIVELGAASAFLLVGLLFQTIFLSLAVATPGMRCARISLCTFDGQIPTRAQLRQRLGALLLSVLPVGLGVAWALFDDDHLCWHDRLSKTYLRKY